MPQNKEISIRELYKGSFNIPKNYPCQIASIISSKNIYTDPCDICPFSGKFGTKCLFHFNGFTNKEIPKELIKRFPNLIFDEEP